MNRCCGGSFIISEQIGGWKTRQEELQRQLDSSARSGLAMGFPSADSSIRCFHIMHNYPQ